MRINCSYTGCPLNGGVEARLGNMEEVKKNKEVLYHFAVFAIINELSIIKYRHISPAYWLCKCAKKCSRPFFFNKIL